MASELLLAIVLIPVSVIGIVWLSIKSKKIRSFIQVDASILKLDTKLVHGEGAMNQKNIDIEYTYNYGGSEYESTAVNVLAPGNSATWTDQIVLYERLKKIKNEGQKLPVWVNPNNPAESTIVKEIYSSTWWFFNVVGILGVIFLFAYIIN